MLYLAGTAPEKARSLHFAITQCSYLAQRSVIVFRQNVAHRVQLQTERQAQRVGQQGGCIIPQRRARSRGGGSLQKSSSGNPVHVWKPSILNSQFSIITIA